ncbi:hypothetical protein HYT05_00785 [Candidatus Kaiserbacteria bacterium]|nr:hypothetical protein [Candidatus Kaiserbacteria bacterium]
MRNARLSGSPEYIFRNILQLVVYGHYDSLLTDERAIYDEALKIASWVNGVRVKWFF